jgi:alpha-tubulin suppressor-like RCC1 family protein
MKTSTLILIAALPMLPLRLPAAAPSGHVIGWGSNISGEATGIPTPDTYYSEGIVKIAGLALSNIVAVSADNGHSLALTSEGTVFGWGDNFAGEATGSRTAYPYRASGQVQISGRTLSNVVAISAGEHLSLVLKSDGTVVNWGEGPGENNWGVLKVPPGVSNIVAIASGIRSSLAVNKRGGVVQWGVGGDLEPAPSGISNIIAVATGGFNRACQLGLNRDGTVVAWEAAVLEPVPAEATNVVSIAAGETHRLALRSDGTVVGWGGNQFGEATGVPTTSFPNSSSGVVCISGQVIRNVVAIAAGNGYSLALKSDGTVSAWGRFCNKPAGAPGGLSGVVAIAAGQNFCLAITTNAEPFALKK